MPPERYPKDLELTVEDFTDCGWKEVLEGAKDKNRRLVYSAFSEAAKQATDEGQQAHGKTLWLLADACSMMLSPDSVNEPFKPSFESPNSRSPIPDDFSKTDIVFFAEIVETIDDPWLKARLADLVWLRQHPRNPCFALAAIDSYRTIPLDTETWICGGQQCWQRAIGLARMLGAGAGNRLTEMEVSIIQAFESVTRQDGILGTELVELLRSNDLGKGHALTIARKLQSLANEYAGEGNLFVAREYFQASVAWFKTAGDDAKSIEMTVAEAESWAQEALATNSSDQPSHRVAASFYENAIQTYRTIPRSERATYQVDERIAELHSWLRESGEKSLDEMGVVSSPGVDITRFVEDARKAVSGKAPFDALQAFVALYGGANAQQLRESAIENLQHSPLLAMLSIQVMSDDGRTSAKLPGMTPGATSTDGDERLICYWMISNHRLAVDLAVRGRILPALEVLLLEHRLREADFIAFARRSSIVPIGRARLFGKALFAGYDRDFITASHLLVPQIEHMVRFHLKQAGVKTTTLDSNGIETENGLSSLIEFPETEQIFGENRSFEIKALFCDSSGPNLRNNIAHGLLDDGAFQSAPPIYAWWFGLKLVFNALTEMRTAVPMKNPPHPGKVVRISCLEPLELNVTEGAKVLGVSRQALSNLVNRRARMSVDMAVRLAKAFGSTTETWIRLQAAYDVAQAQAREAEIEVERYEPRPAVEQ